MDERCEVCGFVWVSVPEDRIATRVEDGVADVVAAAREDAAVTERPEPARWSTLEYAAHLRDVLLHVRDRVVIALVEDVPGFKPLYRDERVALGLYEGDDPSVVLDELRSAGALFARTFRRVPGGSLDRRCIYAFPTPTERTIRWMGQQVVHEVEHHLADVRANGIAAGRRTP